MNEQKYNKYLDSVKSFRNKTVLITGANGGLGFALAKQLAQKGANLIFACRNIDKAEKAKREIELASKQISITVIKLDLSSFESISGFSKVILDLPYKIDAFVLNAGIFHPDKILKTKDSLPLTIGTNFISYYFLLNELKDYFYKYKNTKVLVINSVAAHFGKTNKIFEYLTSLKGSLFRQYSISKRMISCLPQILDESILENIVLSYSHPGITGTDILNKNSSSFPSWFKYLGKKFMNFVFNTPNISSLCLLKALESDESIYSFPKKLFHFSGYPKISKIKKFSFDYFELKKNVQIVIDSILSK